jgi:hypothetical protein
MIAVDTSSLVGYLNGDEADDTPHLEAALADHLVVLPPAVLCELLSDPALPPAVAALFRRLPLLPPGDGYWERAGRLRAEVRAKQRRAPLADALIAQSCLDHRLPLLTRDRDFDAFAAVSPLRLLP